MIGDVFSSGSDLINMIGLTEEQAWKEFGKLDRQETSGGLSYATAFDGEIVSIVLIGDKGKIIGISVLAIRGSSFVDCCVIFVYNNISGRNTGETKGFD